MAVEVPKALAEHRIYLDQRGATPLVALRCLAKATNASLVATTNGFRLERTGANLRAIRERRLHLRVNWFKERLKDVAMFRKTNLATGNQADAILRVLRRDDEAVEAVHKGLSGSLSANSAAMLLPSAMLLEALVQRIGVSTLATIPSDRTVVFEDAPVATASPLPAHGDLDEVYASGVESLLASPLRESIKNDETLATSDARLHDLPDEPRRATRLRLRVYANENSISTFLEAYDLAGRRLDSAFLMASPSGTRVTPSSFMREDARRPTTAWLDLTPPAREALEFARSSVSALPDWYIDPVAKEPLDLFVREAVAGLLASEKGPCVAMDVPDDLWSDVKSCGSKGRIDLDALRKTLAEWLPYDRLYDVDGTSWRLMDPESAEARFAGRDVLRRFARTVSVGKAPDFRAVCHLCHDVDYGEDSLADLWVSAARNAGPPPTSAPLSCRTCALLGGIPDALWADLMNGGGDSAKALGIEAALRRFFIAEVGLLVQNDGSRPIADIDRYPLELYTRDDVGESRLSVASSPESVFRIWPPDKKEPAYWILPEAIEGMFRIPPPYFRLQGHQWVCRLTRENYEKGIDRLSFRRGTQQVTKLRIGLPKNLWIPIDLTSQVMPEPTALHYRDLPQEIRDANWEKALREGMADAQKRLKDAGNPSTGSP